MISPELLRRYPFFNFLDDHQLKEVAMITEQEEYVGGATLFKEGEPAENLFLLINGGVDLFFSVKEEFRPDVSKEYFIGEVDQGEVFGISTLIEPYLLTSTARTSGETRLIRIDGTKLRHLLQKDPGLACQFTAKVAKVAIERLVATRVLLAAAWA